jgi:8-oxo-dGTP diphosphatase
MVLPITQADLSMAPVYAGALVFTQDGKLLCQLRDDKPHIVAPGIWSCCPGGSVEPGETPHEAIVRELLEEFEVEVTELKSLHTHREYSVEYAGTYHAFQAQLATPIDDVRCNEGQRVSFYKPEQALELPQHPVSLTFLKHYLKSGTGL